MTDQPTLQPPSTLPRVSVIVSTLDRAEHLRRLLPALEQLDYPDVEVVVVNGPSTDDTETVLAAYGTRLKTARCDIANLSRSRNLGIAAAAGDVLAFIDDDALPSTSDWLQRLVTPLVADPRLGGVGGRSLVGDSDEYEFDGRLASEYAELASLEEAGARRLVPDGMVWTRVVQGNNCAFRREALVAIGGFDENFPYYLDETDVCLRLARAGHPIAYTPSAAVRHYNAVGAHRRSAYDRRWDLMARSDLYYVLVNARAPLHRRLSRGLALSRTKWPYRMIAEGRHAGNVGRAAWIRYLARWSRGVLAGVVLGLVRVRRTPLAPGSAHPTAFRPFRRPA